MTNAQQVDLLKLPLITPEQLRQAKMEPDPL